MIVCSPYRRIALIEPEGCCVRVRVAALALACHKGDASQSQTSTQVGAQPGGVALNGVTINQGGGNSGPPHGQRDFMPGSGGGNVVSIATDANAPAAYAALQSALDATAQANARVSQVAEAAINQNASIGSTVQKWAAFASLAGGAYLAYRIFFKHKTS